MNKDLRELLNLFFDLVKIDSPSGFEKEVGLWVKNYLEELGLKVSLDKEGNLFTRVKGVGEPILFCAHFDTVEPGREIKPVIRNGYVESGGRTILGADNKAALACILLAVKKVLSRGMTHRPIELLFSTREETDGGIKFFDTKRLSAKVGFIFDCMEKDLGRVIVASPFISDFKARVRGRGSHASRPEEGIDAIKIASAIISQFPTGRLDEDSTFNIGLINGGTATNAVSSAVEFSGDLRSYSHEKFKQHKSRFRRLGKDMAAKMGGRFFITWQPYCNGYCHNLKSTPMSWLRAIYRNFGLPLEPVKGMGGSDANFLNARGINAFVLGDGVENAHTTRERISLANLGGLYRTVYTLMTKW